MGRTLHYSITKENGKKFTTAEIKKLIEISDYYNSGDYKDIWTCENFYLSPDMTYPNWKFLEEHFGKERDAQINAYNAKYDEFAATGLKGYDLTSLMLKAKYALLHDPISNSCYGFTKVQGNELNSSLVLMALTDVSKAFPKYLVKVSDEGNFLKTSLLIRNGKALPDFDREIERMQDWSFRTIMSKAYSGNVHKRGLKVPKGFCKEFMQDFNLTSNYGNVLIDAMNQWLADMREVQDVIMENPKFKSIDKDDSITSFIRHNHTAPYIFNLKNLDPKEWFEVGKFCRPVNPEDFKECKVTVGTLMAGFNGEYWNLNPQKDSESESYKIISQIQKVVGAGDNMIILGDKK